MAESIELQIVAVDLATGVIDKIANSLTSGLKNAALAVGAAFVAGIGAAVLTLKDLADAAGEAQLSQARFNALVDSSSLADFKNEMLGLADALAKVTRFEDENILEAEAMLATYDTIGRETFPAVLDATLDLAEFMKTDATSAAQTLGRAFADIEGGSLSLLKRSRLLTAEQVEMATEMAKAGDVAGAQALIIEALDGKIGNLAETMGGTFEGQKTIFLNAINDIKEDLGMKLLPILTPLIEKFGLLAEKYAPMLAEAFDQYVVPVLSSAADAFTDFIDKLDNGEISLLGMSEAFKNWARSVDWQEVSDNLVAGIENVDWAGIGQDVRTFSANMWKGISEAAKEIDWDEIGNSINVALLETLAGLTGQGSMDNVIDTWAANIQNAPGWAEIGSAIVTVIYDAIVREFYVQANRAKVAVMALYNAINSGLTNLAPTIIGKLILLPGMITVFVLGTLVPAIVDILGAVKKAFFNAFQAAMQQAIFALNGMKASVLKAITDFMNQLRGVVGKGIAIAISVAIPNFARLAQIVAEGMSLLQAAMQGGGGGGFVGGKAKMPRSGQGSGGVGGGGGGGPVGDGFASGGIARGPQSGHYELLHGDEAVIPLKNGSVPVAMGGGGGGNFILNLTYAPAFSTSDKSELLNNLVPMLDQWYRQRLAS